MSQLQTSSFSISIFWENTFSLPLVPSFYYNTDFLGCFFIFFFLPAQLFFFAIALNTYFKMAFIDVSAGSAAYTNTGYLLPSCIELDNPLSYNMFVFFLK